MEQGVAVYQWAHEDGLRGMARPAALEAQGFVKVRQHPRWPLSWLMRLADPAWPNNSTS